MTSNKDMPIVPTVVDTHQCDIKESGGRYITSNGLTKLEHFAGLAMQGLLAGGYCIDDQQNRLEDVSSEAIGIAETLLAQLEEKDCE